MGKPSTHARLPQSPITTPQGGGFKSLNVTTRAMFGLYANVRPCASYAPFIATKHPKMDLVIIRENEEDVYTGIEYQQTDEVVQCLKLISRPGTEKSCATPSSTRGRITARKSPALPKTTS